MKITNPPGIPFSSGNAFLHWDAATKRLGINQSSTPIASYSVVAPGSTNPSAAFSAAINQNGSVVLQDAGNIGFVVGVSGPSSNRGINQFLKANGTLAVPTAVAAGDFIGSLLGSGYESITPQFRTVYSADILATEAFTNAATGTRYRLRLVAPGTVGVSEKFGWDGNGTSNQIVLTVATLPAAVTAGRKGFVSDALAPVFGAAVVGGGAVVVPVYDTGVAWFVG